MGKDKKVIHLRDKSGQHYAGSQSLEGKLVTPTISKQVKSTLPPLAELLFSHGEEYQAKVRPAREQYGLDILKAQEKVSTTLRIPDGGQMFAGYRPKILERMSHEDFADYKKAERNYAKDSLAAACRLASVVTLAKKERDEKIIKAKLSHPKKWWKPRHFYFASICADCGSDLRQYTFGCGECNENRPGSKK